MPSDTNEIDSAFMTIVKNGVDALIADEDGMLYANVGTIAELAKNNRLPAISGRNLAEGGGPRRVISRQGDKPGDLLVQQSSRVDLTINMKAAKALRLTVPAALLSRADKVIE